MIRSPRNLTELCHIYECEDHEEHRCGYCAEGELTMEDPRPEYNEVVRFSLGREATYDELSKHNAGKTITSLARQHMQRNGGTFQEALRAIQPICPGEFKDYFQFQLSDDSFLLPRGIKTATAIEFLSSDGWTLGGVEDWVESQGFVGGTITATRTGWTYMIDKGQNAFPR